VRRHGIARAESDYSNALAVIANQAGKDQGIAVGRAAAAASVARRKRRSGHATRRSNFPGDPAGPVALHAGLSAIAFAAGWGQLKPFALRDAAQFRPGPPLA
jgi:hypothetical protein